MTRSANLPNLRPISPVGFILAIAVLLLLTASGVTLFCLAFANGLPVAVRTLLVLGAIAALTPPTYAVTVTTRRYLSTGELLPSLDERLANRRRLIERHESPRYQRTITLVARAAVVFWLVSFLGDAWAFLASPTHRLHDITWAAFAVTNLITFWPRAKRPLLPSQPQPAA